MTTRSTLAAAAAGCLLAASGCGGSGPSGDDIAFVSSRDGDYAIYLMDADAPDRNNPASRNLRLFLGGNYTLTNTPGILGTAMRFNTSSPPFTPFQQPAPRASSGIHRYVYALYVQPERFSSVGFEVAMPAQRENWNVS